MNDTQAAAKARVARAPASNKLINRSWTELATGRLTIALVVLLGIAERALWNPTLGLGVYASAGLACLTRLRIERLITTTALAAGLAALLVVPWTLRNQHVMGSAISLRSNAGLELVIANYPEADAETEPRARYFERLEAIHPTWSERAYQEVLSIGEVAYFQRLGEETNRWMRENPSIVLKLAIGHLRQVFAPEPWQFRTFGNPAFAGGKAALATLAGLGGLLGLALALVRRRRCWIHPALLVAVPALLLCLFQPVPRYTYLFYPLLVFCAADAVAQIKRLVRTRRG